jgi:hypothetical protein
MKTISLSEFQQDCVKFLEEIGQTHQSIFISKQDKLLVQVIPIFPLKQEEWLGCMADSGKITGDIVGPTEGELVSWEVLAS